MYTLILFQAICTDWLLPTVSVLDQAINLYIIGKLHKKGDKRLYSLALILLWIAVIVSFTSDWSATRPAFVADNNSSFAIYFALGTNDPGPASFGFIAAVIGIILSDSILVSIA